MRRALAVLVVVCSLGADAAAFQQKRSTTRTKKPAPAKPAPPKTEPAQLKCVESLGTGVRTAASYCFVLAGRDPMQGVVVSIPPHKGVATLLFDLHNRHTYSEEDVRAGRGFAKYTAIIGVLTMDGQLLGRAGVQTEFRTAADFYERISGGAGPGGVKAVAPVGREQIAIDIPENVTQVSLLGEVLDATTAAGRETATPGRHVAVVSNVRVEYRPGPPPAASRKKH